uniref:Reverse transcriptase zinc-binding domain-containing protein n=1 Tax=Quercus lobata TaxID=97700 RepID=A0A7N2RBZ0_QUELO
MPRGEGDDNLIWKLTKTDVFDVRFYYKLLSGPLTDVFPWGCIWWVKVPKRVSFFLWTAARGGILTIDNLVKRGQSLVNRCCFYSSVYHELSAIRQDLESLLKTVEDLVTQMKGNQVPSDLDIDKEVQVSTEVSMFMQSKESTIESQQQEASILEESSIMHEDLQLDEVKIVDIPIPHIEFVIPKKFHEVEYKKL